MFSKTLGSKRSKDGPYFVDDICKSMSTFLIDDNPADSETPYKQFLDKKKLDYSLDSLLIVDEYLNKVRRKRKLFSNNDLVKIISRCGSYCGEVIKRNSKIDFSWMKYDDLVDKTAYLRDFEKSPLNYYILISDNGNNLSFPMAKVEKYIAFGKSDSLYYFAKVVGKFE